MVIARTNIKMYCERRIVVLVSLLTIMLLGLMYLKCMGLRVSIIDMFNFVLRRKLTLTLPTNGIRSVGIVHSQSKAMEFVFVLYSC
jgi:hypothetical protein